MIIFIKKGEKIRIYLETNQKFHRMQLILMSNKDEENMVATNHKNSETTDFVEKDENLTLFPSNFKNFLKTGKDS